MPYLVEMKNVVKSFFGVQVLNNVDFTIDKGEVMALCGENGAGKSTLMKILAALYSYDSGDIYLDGEYLSNKVTTLGMQQRGVSMIHQELNLIDTLTVAQNIFLTREPLKNGVIDYKKMRHDVKELLEMLDQNIDPNEKIENLKIAQKQMVEIAKSISFNVKVIIMDEPTSMLSPKETDVLFNLIRKLSASGIGIIYISHRLQEIKQVCDKVTILRDGYLVARKNVSEVSEQEIANLMVGREVQSSVAGQYTGDENDVTIEVRGVSDAFLKDVSFKARKGEIVGFSGLVGSGRSELMEFIFGIRKSQKGELILNGKPVKISNPQVAIKEGLGFATEDRHSTGLFLIRSIRENTNIISQVKYKGVINNEQKRKKNASEILEQLNVRFHSQLQLVGSLSGGNQQKVIFGKWLLVDSNILILDEPTRGIDVGARQEIYNIINNLADEGKTIIIISSDMTEILSICHRVIVMSEGRITADLSQDDRTEEKIMHNAVVYTS